MTDLNQILSIGKSSLLAQQRAIQTTSHNIANANTPGYTRQRVNLSAASPILTAAGMSGTGVEVVSTERIYDRFVDAQIVGQNGPVGQWEALDQTLAQVDVIFNEINSDGIGSALDSFWGAWQDLANNPGGPAERQALLSQSELLTANFNQAADALDQIQADLTTQIALAMDGINGLTQQVADLNDKIFRVEISGQNANDLRDERQQVLNVLSRTIGAEVTENGSYAQVSLGGQPLVEYDQAYELSFSDPDFEIDAPGGPVSVPAADISGGEVAGWLAARDAVIPQYQSDLDALAAGLITALNIQHSAGYGLGDATGGQIFFSGTNAGDIAVDPAISADPNLIAAAGDPGGLPGDNQNALAIADLQFTQILNGGSQTLDAFYQTLVVRVGNDASQATAQLGNETALETHLFNLRQSISGVSIDEETINLLKYEQAYQAASRIITTADKMFETLINMI
ncbi:MAG: flagellar hook-associated protein FlgK [Desulfobacterales bacterium]